ncbi:SP_0198 family lipoprotein [uncultured Streptococcus sp.]|uniref:SP_0198 family lipoprotein n=1 Tax=uncultured Streptococcus sp. TaxID=83427 RepID=UPI00288B654C|nr:SP_0198 family lipoprotein [uncultured Streptococcus sp.]
MSLKKFTLSLAALASLSLLVACSPKAQSTPSSQASTSAEASISQKSETSASSSTASSVTNIDGTYTGQDDGDTITLVVTGNTGTWTEVEPDGDQKIKKVTFEPENQRVFVGDDIKVYVAEENQIIIDDMDREISDRIVLKK